MRGTPVPSHRKPGRAYMPTNITSSVYQRVMKVVDAENKFLGDVVDQLLAEALDARDSKKELRHD